MSILFPASLFHSRFYLVPLSKLMQQLCNLYNLLESKKKKKNIRIIPRFIKKIKAMIKVFGNTSKQTFSNDYLRSIISRVKIFQLRVLLYSYIKRGDRGRIGVSKISIKMEGIGCTRLIVLTFKARRI